MRMRQNNHQSSSSQASSETQGQIVGARESLNGRENKVRKKVKNGEKSPWGQCLTRPVLKRSPPFRLLIGARKLVFFWRQWEARTAATVWNWSGKTLSQGAFLAVLYFSFVPYFSTCLDFPSPPLSAPGSPRMHPKLCGTILWLFVVVVVLLLFCLFVFFYRVFDVDRIH